jgi:hypothetical protein
MNREPRSIRVLLLLTVAAVVCACEPFAQNDNGASNCQLSITDSSGTGQVLSTSSEGAQSFIPNSASPFLTVGLRLATVSTTNSNLSGTLTVLIERDLNASGTVPTQPECGPNSFCGVAFGTLDISTIALTQPVFYSIPISPSVTPTVGVPLWVVVFVTYGSGGTTNIVWSGSTSQAYTGPALAQSGGSWATTPLAGNLDVQIGCQ